MKTQETICHKLDEAVDDIQALIKTGKMDIYAFVRRLHNIRRDATQMEYAIKRRKKAMEKHGIEKEYQHLKRITEKQLGINEIGGRNEEKSLEPAQFQFIVKEKGKVVYDQIVHGGVFSMVEEITNIDVDGIMDGRSQQIFFGHPLVIWYGFDQLEKAMQAKRSQILISMKEAIETRAFADPEVKSQIIEAANNGLKK